MARRKKSHRKSHRRHGSRARRGGMTPQRRKFKAAVKVCWSEMKAGKIDVSPKSLGRCMKKKL
jgi:hypothetical protein